MVLMYVFQVSGAMPKKAVLVDTYFRISPTSINALFLKGFFLELTCNNTKFCWVIFLLSSDNTAYSVGIILSLEPL